MYAFLRCGGRLVGEQSGFRKGHSTITCLLNFLDEVYNNIENGDLSGVLFLDLKKAFDTVDHCILCRKIRSLGVKESSVSWLKSYLTNRTQSVKYNGKVSVLRSVKFGVSQGSILVPLLFVIYINDFLSALINSHKCLYADDTAIIVEGKTAQELEEKLNYQLDMARLWLNKKS